MSAQNDNNNGNNNTKNKGGNGINYKKKAHWFPFDTFNSQTYEDHPDVMFNQKRFPNMNPFDLHSLCDKCRTDFLERVTDLNILDFTNLEQMHTFEQRIITKDIEDKYIVYYVKFWVKRQSVRNPQSINDYNIVINLCTVEPKRQNNRNRNQQNNRK